MKRNAQASKRDFAFRQKNSKRKNRPKTLSGRKNKSRNMISNLNEPDERMNNNLENNKSEIIHDNNPGFIPIREDFIFD